MKTTIILILVWFIISIRNINKKSYGIFDPFCAGFYNWMGFWFGGVLFFIVLIHLIIKYLP
jgi:hypothetical protein